MSVLTALMADSASVTLVLIFTILLFYFLFKSSSKRKKYKLPPGPWPWPIIGNLHILNAQQPDETMCKLSKQYGDVLTFHMGVDKVVVITGYEAVKQALVNQAEDFGERGITPAFHTFSNGKGVVFSNGELWKTMRRFTLTTLRDFGMGRSTVEDRILEEAQRLVGVFQEHHGKPFDPLVNIYSAVSNIICQLVFGHRFEYDDPVFLQLQRRVTETTQLTTSPELLLYNLFPKLGMVLGDFNKIDKHIKANINCFRDICHQRKSELNSNDLRSFLDSFLARQKEEESRNSYTYFDEENLVMTIGDLFGAGTETTSTTLRWGLLYMMKFPHIQEKVRAEIERVIGRDRPPRTEDRKSMPYTDAVVHEIQRFGNIIPSNLLRQTTKDITFRGYHIPKGTLVLPVLTSVLFDETQWETPYEFNPGHFLDADGRFVKKDAFLPFSAGRRACAGENLAKMELFLFFTALMQRFHFQLPEGIRPEDLDLTPVPGITCSPKPYKLCAVVW